MFQYSVIKWFYNLNYLPRWVIILIDIGFLAFSTLLGYFLRFNFDVSEIQRNHFLVGTSLSVLSGFLTILFLGSYKGIVRYTGIQDGVRIFFTVLTNSVVICLVNLLYYMNTKTNLIPYSVVLISYLASFLFLFNYRLLVKYIFSFYNRGIVKNSKVLIFGSGQTGLITKHVIDSSPSSTVFGFLEDDVRKIGKVINGSKIFSASNHELEELFVNIRIDELIITVKNLSITRKNELVDICLRHHVKIRVVPPVDRWVRGELSLNQIKDIHIEDLLERESIKLDNPHLKGEIKGKTICITGAAGSIGSELVRQIIRLQPKLLILVDQAESPLFEIDREVKGREGVMVVSYIADISNEERMDYILQLHRPAMIFHAAAYKHVPLMENNPSEAVLCNIIGTKIMADLAVKHGVEKFVMISTDKAVNPTNVMGCSKRIAEIYVQSLNNHIQNKASGVRTSFVTTRFGNVLGSNGSVIPVFKKQIEQGGPITVTHPEITRYFMTIPEACQLVLEAGVMGNGGEIFIFDMGESVKIYDLARKMVLLSGLEPGRDIDIVFTGLRDGEKLYEELLNTQESTMPTHHSQIMIAKVKEYQYLSINNYIELFPELVNDKNELKMVALMKELVPEFVSNYSRFEILDQVSR